MPSNNEEHLNSENTSELLWKYIEELKRADGSGAVNFVVRTPLDPAEFAALMPLTDAVQEALHADQDSANGRDTARARLMETIRAQPRPEPSPAGHGWLSRLWLPKNRLLTVCGLLVLLAVAALGIVKWEVYQASCRPSTPYPTGGTHPK